MQNIKFIKSAFATKHLPDDGIPEVILCGRSNVGKSSFINSIFNRKSLAKTSSTPGKTRSLNYYLVNDLFYLVDLPGFGYAKVSKKERESWQKFITDYLSQERNIALAFHFVDSRHHPTPLDVMLNDYLMELDIPVNVILSKVDKLKQSELSKSVKTAMEYFPHLSLNDNLLIYSSVKNTGRKEILSRFNSIFK
ncbi:MAG: YihA family ribosome biogenesis GTP-binding protein [Melioribacteraceae bacterium]|nr:YihA family ribosome biogenesis GTP-binding protein [Melioribacteraceae bacterium]